MLLLVSLLFLLQSLSTCEFSRAGGYFSGHELKACESKIPHPWDLEADQSAL